MIVNNTATEIGDILTIYSQAAISASTINLTGFTDSIIGETPTRFFVKSFRYSIDGVNYSNFQELNVLNLSSITGRVVGLLFFEFRYVRSGIDSSGILEFQNINIIGNVTVHICTNTATVDTIFENLICDNTITSEICANLLEKIYKNGIIPQYILRESNEGYPNDYVAFWSGICLYFSMFSAFIETYDSIFQTKEYLKEHLKQRGSYFCDKITFGDLQYISSRFFDEIRKRGTIFIIRKKDFILQDSTSVEIDGEWIRILCQNEWDEFLVELAGDKQRPWSVDNNSPTYNGTLRSMQLNKTKENTEDFQSLLNYQLSNATDISLFTDSIGKTLRLSPSIVSETGIGAIADAFVLFQPVLPEDMINVDDSIDYEISFRIRRTSGSFAHLSFGVLGFNQDSVWKTDAFKEMQSTSSSRNFINDSSDKTCRILGEWYYVRGIIYAKGTDATSAQNALTNIGIGNNLRFNVNEKISKIQPFVHIKNTTGCVYDIFDYKVRPLIKGKNILPLPLLSNPLEKQVKNPNFIQSTATIYSYMKNNNDSLTDEQVNKIIEKYLIPYENKLSTVNLSKQQI